MKLTTINLLLLLLCFSVQSFSQSNANIAVRLGYPANTKLLIIHADDLGVSHSENSASIQAMEKGTVNSASIMVPCPWFSEIANYAATNRDKDFGLHLTLTSEWKYYKWSPVTSTSLVSSLVNNNGYFYSLVDSMIRHAKLSEVELELRNQIKKALQNNIDVTHLDAHMGGARSNRQLINVYINLGREFKVPVLLDKGDPIDSIKLNSNDVVVDYSYTASGREYDGGLANYYRNVFKNMKPGLSCLLIHTAYADSESQAMMTGFVYWGAKWRQDDFDFFTSEECKTLLKENNIKLVTWREVRDKISRK